ncbi:MAG: serine hydrolase [Myxococcaceae bacterium]|nr:serine hydrolase [Myxococcaceae bacterium]
MCANRAVFALCVLAAHAQAQVCPPGDATFPDGDWPSRPVQGKAAEVAALEKYAFEISGGLYGRQGLHTNAVVVIHRGVLVYEKYARGFGPSNRHLSWSVAKSISSALVGVAVERGVVSLDDSICVHLAEYAGQDVCRITVRDTITFGTGLDWAEEYENGKRQTSSVLPLFFGSGHRDQLRHILTHRFAAAPGTQWRYSTADAQLAAAVAKRALTPSLGADPFWPALFDPIGMREVVVEEDALGTPLGGSSFYATPREFAKFGYLFLKGGCWKGRRLLPDGWVAQSATPSAVFVSGAPEGETRPSGYAWWLGRPVPERGVPSRWPDAPEDTYAAQGYWGQRIIVVPSEELVIVRTGDDRQEPLNTNDLVKHVLPVLR